MPKSFTLTERPGGLFAHPATPGELAMVVYGELVTPDDPARVQQVLESLQQSVFNRIPDFPDPSQIRQLVVVILKDLACTAYINELSFKAWIPIDRDVKPGDVVFVSDLAKIREINLGIDIAEDAAVIIVSSFGWRRSVYFDFGPMFEQKRVGALSQVLAQQLLALFGLGERVTPQQARSRADAMAEGYQELRRLLSERCEVESRYQEVLQANAWMLGGTYKSVRRHPRLDDENIPDFTAVRSADDLEDIIELKQPYLECFKSSESEFSANFHYSWAQAERYVVMARDQRTYLSERKGMRFVNPRCLLIMGKDWSQEQMRAVRGKESLNLNIKLYTYDELLAQAAQLLSLARTAALPE